MSFVKSWACIMSGFVCRWRQLWRKPVEEAMKSTALTPWVRAISQLCLPCEGLTLLQLQLEMLHPAAFILVSYIRA